jgi:hypothetical protein
VHRWHCWRSEPVWRWCAAGRGCPAPLDTTDPPVRRFDPSHCRAK